jgi:putative oxidoreductase
LGVVAFVLFGLASAALFHTNWADQIQFTMFMKNVAIGGGFLVLAAVGAGAYSIDAWLLRRKAQR